MTAIKFLFAARRAMDKNDSSFVNQVMDEMGDGVWSMREVDGNVVIVWKPPPGKYLDALLVVESGHHEMLSYLGAARTVDEAFTELIMQIAITLFAFRFKPLAVWLAKISCSTVLGLIVGSNRVMGDS